MVLWATAGLVFWIPLLVRATVSVGVAVLYCALTESDPRYASARFARAATFYSRGFGLLRTVLFPPDRRASGSEHARGALGWGHFALEMVWAGLFWGGVVLVAGGALRPGPVTASGPARLDDASFLEAAGEPSPPDPRFSLGGSRSGARH